MRPLLYATAVALAATMASPPELAAQTVRVRTATLGDGMQFRKGDLSVEAQRRVVQGVNVWGFHAAPFLPGTLDVHVGVYYLNDFGIAEEDRGNPWVELDRSRFLLEQANVRYEPIRRVKLTAGRQWVGSALGVRDIDGGRVRIAPELDGGVVASIDAFAGRDVQSGYATLNTDAWDVQGLPLQSDGGAPGGIRIGGALGLAWDDAAMEVAWQRSERQVDGATVAGDERLGAAIRGNVSRRVVLSSQASYHLLLEDVDRAALDLAWRAPWAQAVLSGGIEHRQPWFDASSIFNVFGARPFEGAHVVYQHPVGLLRTAFELRSWARAYDGNLDLADLGGGAEDARAVGAGVGHTTSFDGFGVPFEWRSFASLQTSPSNLAGGEQGGDEWVGDTRFRFPAVPRRLFLTGRFIGVYARPGATSTRTEGSAFTAVVTGELPVSFGKLVVSVDGTRSTWFEPNVNAWASFASEFWF